MRKDGTHSIVSRCYWLTLRLVREKNNGWLYITSLVILRYTFDGPAAFAYECVVTKIWNVPNPSKTLSKRTETTNEISETNITMNYEKVVYVAWLCYSQSNFVFSSLMFVIRGYQTNQFPKATGYNTWWRKAVSFKIFDKIICKYSWHCLILLFLIKHLKIISDPSPGSCASCLLRLVLVYIFGL